MRALALLLLLLPLSLFAEDTPHQLDPSKPADAVLIVDGLTRQLALPRDQGVALTLAIQTLGALVREHAEAKAAPAPAITTPVKKD